MKISSRHLGAVIGTGLLAASGSCFAGPVANLVSGLLNPSQGASAASSPARTQVQLPLLPALGNALAGNRAAAGGGSRLALPGLGGGASLNGRLIGSGGFLPIAFLAGDNTGNADGSHNLLGNLGFSASVLSGNNSGNGGAVALGILSKNDVGHGSLAGIGLLSGDRAGFGSTLGLGILSKNGSGVGNLVGIGLLSGEGSGKGSVANVGLLNAGDLFHVCYFGKCVTQASLMPSLSK